MQIIFIHIEVDKLQLLTLVKENGIIIETKKTISIWREKIMALLIERDSFLTNQLESIIEIKCHRRLKFIQFYVRAKPSFALWQEFERMTKNQAVSANKRP